MLIILAVGASISLATALSIAAIATNTEVKGGGAYYLISRVLGPCFGTSIGLTLFVSQSLAIPFNILGASESLVTQWPQLRPYFPLLNLGLGGILAFLVWKGADWAIKAQYFIMAVLGVSILVFLLGPIGSFSFENLAGESRSRGGGRFDDSAVCDLLSGGDRHHGRSEYVRRPQVPAHCDSARHAWRRSERRFFCTWCRL